METKLTVAPELMIQEQQTDQLARRTKAGDTLTAAKRQELKKISRDFEAMFTSMMLKAMRSTVPEDKLTGGGNAEETYRYLLDQEYANIAAHRGGSGSIAAMVEKELLKRYEPPVILSGKPNNDDGDKQ
ncbi:MAG: rod-binding protein [Trichlorobacter sp.]|jgi:flagellar protein FlgJ|nr:rod-binding protein [Trichlorobacter sp.]